MCVRMHVQYIVITYSRVCGLTKYSKQVTNPACGQLNRENVFSLSPFVPENLVSRDRSGRPVPRQPAHSPHSRVGKQYAECEKQLQPMIPPKRLGHFPP